MNPRTLWACQPAAFISSARLAPLGRLISASSFAPLLSGRIVPPSFLLAGLAAVFALGSLGALGSAPVRFLTLGVAFVLAADFLAADFFDALFGLCSAPVVLVSMAVASFVIW